MIDEDSVRVLKFIVANQPCGFADIENEFGADFRYSMEINFIDKNHFYYAVGRTPDAQPLLGVTPEGRAALEEYQRSSWEKRRSTIALILALLALFKPSSIDIIEYMKRLVRLLLG